VKGLGEDTGYPHDDDKSSAQIIFHTPLVIIETPQFINNKRNSLIIIICKYILVPMFLLEWGVNH